MALENGALRQVKIAGAVIGIIITMVGGLYGVYAWAEEYHNQFAKAEQVAAQFDQTQALVIQSDIRAYEDELFELEFKISADSATPLDHAKKTKIKRQLIDLRNELRRLTD